MSEHWGRDEEGNQESGGLWDISKDKHKLQIRQKGSYLHTSVGQSLATSWTKRFPALCFRG